MLLEVNNKCPHTDAVKDVGIMHSIKLDCAQVKGGINQDSEYDGLERLSCANGKLPSTF